MHLFIRTFLTFLLSQLRSHMPTGDSVTNLIQPFFTIPIVAATQMRFGDVVGYTF